MAAAVRLVKRYPLCAIISLAALLRFVNLGAESTWYDETFTAWITSRLSFSDMMAAIAGDVHPPLWYWIEWINVRLFGSGEFALRLPAAVLGLAAVALVWRIAHEAGLGRRVALIAALLTAIMPSALYYSQDARMYPLLTCLVLGAVLAAMRRNWIMFALCGIGAVYAQNLALIYIAVLIAVSWLVSQRSIKVLFAGVSVALAWLPWMPTFLAQSADVKDGFWLGPLSLGNAISPIFGMTLAQRMPDTVLFNAYLAAFGFTLVSLISARRWLLRRDGLLIAAATFGAPMALAALSFLWRNVYLHRALLPSSHLLMIFWAWAFVSMSPGNRRVARIIMIPMLAAGVLSHYMPAAGRDPNRQWLEPVVQHWQDGDAVYHTAIHTAMAFGYYLEDKPYALRPQASDLNQSLSESTKESMRFEQASFERLAASHARIWLLVYLNPMSRQDERDEIARVLATYPHQVIDSKSNDLAEMSIYLVEVR